MNIILLIMCPALIVSTLGNIILTLVITVLIVAGFVWYVKTVHDSKE